MRVAHLCLAAFYIDDYGYQENILPRIHKQAGHDVKIFASVENYTNGTEKAFGAAGQYENSDGIIVERFPYSKLLPAFLAKKVRAYKGVISRLEEFKPDLIFCHDIQFWDLMKITKWAKSKKIVVVADTHTDEVNSARSWFSKKILHSIFYRMIAKISDKYILQYYPTLPLRADFLSQYYGLSHEKMRVLPFGAEDWRFAGKDQKSVSAELRKVYGIPLDALVIVTGGKIDKRKNIHILVEEFQSQRNKGRLSQVHLLVFGKPDSEMEHYFAQRQLGPNIHLAGWVDASDVFRYIWSGSLVVFPGTHSVLWEEAIGLGSPAAFKRWRGMEHLDVGGNCHWLDGDERSAISQLLHQLDGDNGMKYLEGLTASAKTKGVEKFAYSKIAEMALTGHLSFNRGPSN